MQTEPNMVTTDQDYDDIDVTASIDKIPKGIPIASLIALRKKGLSYAQIGKVVGCDPSNVYRRLLDYKEEIEGIEDYKQHRADTIAVVQSKILNSINTEDLKKASAYQKVGMFGILYDKERLERGESTQNVSYQDVTAEIGKLEQMLQAQGWQPPVVKLGESE